MENAESRSFSVENGTQFTQVPVTKILKMLRKFYARIVQKESEIFNTTGMTTQESKRSKE